MEENIDWLFDEPLPHLDLESCEPELKTDFKCEAGSEEQVPDGTNVKVESSVKEEVVVKVERGEDAIMAKCLCVSSCGGCGGCVLKSERPEASSEGGCVGVEGYQHLYTSNVEGKWPVLPYVVVKREPETDFGDGGFWGQAKGEQCVEGDRKYE